MTHTHTHTDLRVYTGGTFDLLHPGHVNFLKICSQLGSVTVSLNSDDFVKTYKGHPPVMRFDERRAMLLALPSVEKVVENTGGADSKVAIISVAPNIIAIGSDWARRDYYTQMNFTQDWLDERGISLLYIPYSKGISSSEIKRRLSERSQG